MAEAFDRILRTVGRRTSINVLLEAAGLTLSAGAAAAAAAVIVQRTTALHLWQTWTAAAFLAAILMATLLWWFPRRPGRMQAAILADQRLALRERFSTALATEKLSDPFARAARVDALDAARRASPQGRFPIRMSKRWAYAGGGWLVVMVLALLLPDMDLFGRHKEQQDKLQLAQQIDQARQDVQVVSREVKVAVRKIDDPALAKALDSLDKPMEAGKPAEMRQEAIRKLSNLSDQVKQIQQSENAMATKALERAMKDLRGAKLSPPAEKVRDALAKGDFAKAADAAREIQKDLAASKLTEQQQKDLAEQLAKLGEQLAKLADERKALEDAMEAAGLSKSLATLDAEKLAQALKDRGLPPDKVSELLAKAAGIRVACRQCQGLGEAMAEAAKAGKGGKLGAGDLSKLTEQLSEMETRQMRLQMAQASLEEINQAIAGLGQNQCQGGDQGLSLAGGPGSQGQGQGQGQGQIPGPGMGTGLGMGPRPEAQGGPVGLERQKAPSADGEHTEPITIWRVQGQMERGEARKELREMMMAKKAGFAEAIAEKKVPRKYEGPVARYYEGFQSGGKDSE
jgi:hypothetical protein